jgi:hypothetical protein
MGRNRLASEWRAFQIEFIGFRLELRSRGCSPARLSGSASKLAVINMRSTSALVLSFIVLIGTALAQAPEPPKTTASSPSRIRLRDTLTNMEKKLAQAEQQKNKAFFDQALNPQFLMVAYNGLVFTKPELLSKLDYLDVKEYAMKNFKVRPIGRAGALLTYDLYIQASAAGRHAPSKQYASSVWVRDGGHWRLLFHQATPANH